MSLAHADDSDLAVLTQVLEDATGWRVAVENLLAGPLPVEIRTELAATEVQLSRLITLTCWRLGASADSA
jgi:hypothetical protein